MNKALRTENINDFTNGGPIAFAGASRSPQKFGAQALKELKKRGFDLLPIHPEADKLEDIACVSSINKLKGKSERLYICTNAQQSEELVRQAASAGFKQVWIQQGAASKEALIAAEELGLKTVSGRCILMYAGKVEGFHNFHRSLVKFFGGL